jgi:hypothetical protein
MEYILTSFVDYSLFGDIRHFMPQKFQSEVAMMREIYVKAFRAWLYYV